MSRITIRTQNKKFPVAPNLYGIFFEDINRAGDGGLYPEMLRNRSFEDSTWPKDCHTEQDGYALVTRRAGEMSLITGKGFPDGSERIRRPIPLSLPGIPGRR